MMEVDHPGKLFVGGLNTETDEKTLEAAFGKFGNIVEVLLKKDRDTNKSTGFAFITFQSPSDAKDAAKDMNGKPLDGKTIKVERANKPSFEGGGRRRLPSFSRNRGPPRSLRGGRGGSGGSRGRPSRAGHLGDDGGYTPNLNMSSPRGPFPVKRAPSSRRGGPPSKRSDPSATTRSDSGIGRRGPVMRGRDNYRHGPRREPVSSRRDDYVSPRDDGYCAKNSYSSRIYSSSRNTKDCVQPHRDYTYRDYGHYSSRDEHSSKGYSDREGYGGGRERDYSDHPSGGSYRDAYESYGSSRGAPPTREPTLTYGGNNHCDDYNSTRDGYGGNRESYSSSRSEVYSRGRDRGGRQERVVSSSLDRVYTPRESYSSSRCRGSRGSEGIRSERGGRSRY